MLLRRSLFVLDILVLTAVVVCLAFLPAERCMNFLAHPSPTIPSKCHLHPVYHPEFSFSQNLKQNEHLENVEHHFTVCHRLQWSHFTFWDQMYLILLPAITCACLILYTICEIMEFDLFVGTVQSSLLIFTSICSVIFTAGVIIREQTRIKTEWPLLEHGQSLGAIPEETTVDVPKTWQYSIAMCLLSALFKIGRILIQHFIGDKKLFLDDDSPKTDKTMKKPIVTYGNSTLIDEGEVAGTTRMLNESRYSRIENDE